MILGIESSCDDSSIALIDHKNLELKFYKKISQESIHSSYGGVVPELAARLHTQALPALLDEIKGEFNRIKAIAVTNEPGLSVSLIGGISMAKALSISLGVPLIAVNHLIGHIYSVFLTSKARFPLGVLLVSGGHTLVLNIDKEAKIEILATTGDDSFGESFDKVSKMMSLGYPGGAVIENLALKGRDEYKFTIPLKGDKRVEYSFSGLKNQVRLAIEKSENLDDQTKANIACSFQKTAISHIIDKLKIIYDKHKFQRFAIVGGASANLALRGEIEKLAKKYNSEILYAPLKFCSDNGAMIARVGVEKYLKKEFISLSELQVRPNLNLKKAR